MAKEPKSKPKKSTLTFGDEYFKLELKIQKRGKDTYIGCYKGFEKIKFNIREGIDRLTSKFTGEKAKVERACRLLVDIAESENLSSYNRKRITDFIKNPEIWQVCGNCADWKFCRATEGWRIYSPCSHIGKVRWKPINKKYIRKKNKK